MIPVYYYGTHASSDFQFFIIFFLIGNLLLNVVFPAWYVRIEMGEELSELGDNRASLAPINLDFSNIQCSSLLWPLSGKPEQPPCPAHPSCPCEHAATLGAFFCLWVAPTKIRARLWYHPRHSSSGNFVRSVSYWDLSALLHPRPSALWNCLRGIVPPDPQPARALARYMGNRVWDRDITGRHVPGLVSCFCLSGATDPPDVRQSSC